MFRLLQPVLIPFQAGQGLREGLSRRFTYSGGLNPLSSGARSQRQILKRGWTKLLSLNPLSSGARSQSEEESHVVAPAAS